MTLLQIENLHFKYETSPVLQGINLNIDVPELVGIIGANGCGKTTLLKNISGYLKPYQGTITMSQKNIQNISIREKAQHIGFVPQDIPSDFNFTCYDLVMMGRTPYLKRFQREGQIDQAVVREAMELTHTWHLMDRAIDELSGGEKQRVYIARSLAQKPQILLLDEPVSHLDIKYQVEILTLLKNFASKGILILAILHDINLASQFCEKIIMMKEGKILSQGTPQNVLTHQNLQQAYAINVEILSNPITHTPYIIPLTEKENPLHYRTIN